MFPEAVVAATLAIAGIYDIKYREVPEEVMYLGLILVLTALFSDYVNEIYSIIFLKDIVNIIFFSLSVFVVIIGYAIYKTGFFGEGDYYGLLLIALSNPFKNGFCIFPLAYTSMIVFAIIMIIVALGHALYNLVKGYLWKARIPLKYKLLYFFLARPVSLRNYLAKPGWWYPLGFCGHYRASFDIYADPSGEAEMLRKMIVENKCSEEEIIWVTYGTPALAYMALAYIASIVLGDKWIISLIGLGGICG